MAEIRINYELTVSKGKQIIELSDELRNLINGLETIQSESGVYWQGEAADAYRRQIDELTDYIKKLFFDMSELGSTIIKIANIIKSADEAVARSTGGFSGGGRGGGGGRGW